MFLFVFLLDFGVFIYLLDFIGVLVFFGVFIGFWCFFVFSVFFVFLMLLLFFVFFVLFFCFLLCFLVFFGPPSAAAGPPSAAERGGVSVFTPEGWSDRHTGDVELFAYTLRERWWCNRVFTLDRWH